MEVSVVMAAAGDDEIARLARENDLAERRAARSAILMLFSVFVAVGALVLCTGFWNGEDSWIRNAVLALTTAQMAFFLLLYFVSARREDRAYRALDAAHARRIVRRRWMTSAGAVGVAIEAWSKGRRVKLAFPSGVVAEYSMKDLKPHEERPPEGAAAVEFETGRK